jgi:Spy/CpxP family protein refolding chaperone
MVELLKLTADQKTKIAAIDLELAKEMSKLTQNSQGNRETYSAARQTIDKKRDEKYKPVLTADQFKKYLEDKEQRARDRSQGQRGQGQNQGQRRTN